MTITHERLKQALNYDLETGIFTWEISTKGSRKGDIAGSKHSEGYLRIMIDGESYFAHRLAWMYINGYLPENQIDHINRDRKDNRISNLRSCKEAENHFNLSIRNDNSSGVSGVWWDSTFKRWKAQISKNKKRYCLGTFTNKEDAISARIEAEKKLFGEFSPLFGCN